MVGWYHWFNGWTWANSSRWRGTGWPEVLQPLGSQSQMWLSTWTTLVENWLFWIWTKFLLYERPCIQAGPTELSLWVTQKGLRNRDEGSHYTSLCPSQTPMSQWTWLGLANPDVQKGIQKDLCEEKESFIGKTGKKGEIYQLLLILRTLWCSW